MNGEFYVYLISRPDGRPCYVGKGKGRRWRKHAWRSTNPHLANLYAKHGDLPIEKVASDLTEAEAFTMERDLIAVHGRESDGGILVNLTAGGDGVSGYRFTAEGKAHLSAVRRGKKYPMRGPATEETRKKQRQAKLGRKLSPEHRAKIGASHLGRKRPPEVGAKISAAKTGKRWSEERRAILRAANRSRDPEVRARISAGLLRRSAERGALAQ